MAMSRLGASLAVRLLGAAAIIGAGSAVANAKCTKLGFSVNDYGKDGPTKDAKALLDKYIAKWAADRGIKKYTTGKKNVNCELFLDFGFFDEHTCKATATVCWTGEVAPAATQSDEQKLAGSKKAAPPAPVPAPASKPKSS